jgi:HIV Tat-specific factor 1
VIFQEEPKWFDQDLKSNTKVYVSSLPSDLTELEFAEFMQKCGIIMKDVDTGKLKLKLYADSEGNLKGDGLCSYIKVGKLTI